jgi:hypothetical protein
MYISIYLYIYIYIYIYIHIHIYYGIAGHQRTADKPAGGGQADTPAGGGQAGIPAGAILRMGIRACAMGEGGYGGSPNAELQWRQGRGKMYQYQHSRSGCITVYIIPYCNGYVTAVAKAGGYIIYNILFISPPVSRPTHGPRGI